MFIQPGENDFQVPRFKLPASTATATVLCTTTSASVSTTALCDRILSPLAFFHYHLCCLFYRSESFSAYKFGFQFHACQHFTFAYPYFDTNLTYTVWAEDTFAINIIHAGSMQGVQPCLSALATGEISDPRPKRPTQFHFDAFAPSRGLRNRHFLVIARLKLIRFSICLAMVSPTMVASSSGRRISRDVDLDIFLAG
jgi:hypothetical protein